MKTVKVFICLLIVSLIIPNLLTAQEQKIIVSVNVRNNKAISEATILSKIKSRPGARFSQDILNDDLKRLYALGYFTNVTMDIEEYDEGMIINIVVEEKPIVEGVVFEGNKKINSRHLAKTMQTKKGETLNYSKLSQDVNEIRALYAKYGFQDVGVDYIIDADSKTNTAVVKIIVKEKQRVFIKKISVEGNKAVKSNVILGMMKTKPAFIWLFRKGYFNEEDFSSDLERIKRYYQSLGYLDAVVIPEFGYSADGEKLFIVLNITDGPLYKTGKITIEGKLVFPPEEVAGYISMKEGQAFSYSDLRRDMETLREFYFQRGYMNVEIDVDRNIDPNTHKVDIKYNLKSNDIVYVGTVEIKGNTKTKDIIIRRELRIYPGERFDGDKIRRSKERLYNLGFFEDIYFDTEQTGKPNVRKLVVSVKETKTGEFAFGGGYSSVDQFIGFVQITQKNFDLLNFPYFTGDGQELSLKANIGTVRMDFDMSWTEPWIFDYPLSFGFDGYHRTHARSGATGYGYKEVRAGGDLRLGKEWGERFRTDGMYKLENVNISDLSDDVGQDLVDERGDNWISLASLALTYDTRDNIFVPKKGFLVQAIFENAGGPLGFDKTYYKTFFLASYYYSIFDKLVLEVKGRTGFANAYWKSDEVPIYERFYAGGAYTIRGYAERKVGPRDPVSNDPIGGETMAIANVELTFPIYEKLIKGAIFYDVGNVWRRFEDYFSGGFKHGVGAGIRVKTPIGPLNLDAGYPLSDNQGEEKKIEWYFSMSHGF